MTGADRVALIKKARALVQAAIRDCGSPQIETILRSADMELHWALWNLGEPVGLRPEFEGRDRPASV